MDIPVRKSPIKWIVAILGMLYDIIPDLGLKDPSCLERRIYKTSTLLKDPACSRWHCALLPVPISSSEEVQLPYVGLQLRVEIRFEQFIKVGCIGQIDRIRFHPICYPYAVHDNQQKGPFLHEKILIY